MYIDNVISSFDFDKFKSDCFLYGFLKTYILGQYLENALCFPSGCKGGFGLTSTFRIPQSEIRNHLDLSSAFCLLTSVFGFLTSEPLNF
jgi:hypothetical protein